MGEVKYTCDECGPGTLYQKEQLTVKRVQYRDMGQNGKVIKTRGTAWLCPEHLAADPDFNRPAYDAAPGTSAKRLAVEAEA